MSEPTSLTEIGGIAVAELIKSAFSSIAEYGGAKFTSLHARIFEDFEPFMQECYRKNRFVRILCQDDDDVDLLSVYVGTNFSHRSKSFSDFEVTWSVTEKQNIILTGAGGAGKTFFMRRLWLDIFKEQKTTPIFVELRKLNEFSSFDVETFLRASVSANLPEDLFRTFCDEGRFTIILDGFDELPKERHDEAQRQILDFANKYPNCGIVVASRPDTRFHGWQSFKVFEAEPFTLEQTSELCSRVPFDEEYRKVFIRTLTPDFYLKYRSFLSNPLLSIMMMMTFRRNMEIPRKMGVFYDEAFGTLYQWHDSTKAFRRIKHLDIQQFRRSFGAFCLISYAKEKYDFSRTEIEDIILKSNEMVGVQVSSDLILDDYERNVNLIRQDGLRYHFIHRSFQEYFCAWALINIFPKRLGGFLEKTENRSSDAMIAMCYDLHRTHVINSYIEPRYRDYKLSKRMSPRFLESRVFDGLVEGVAFHIDSYAKNGSVPEDVGPLGFSVDIDVKLVNFMRAVWQMMSEDDATEFFFLLTDVFFSNKIYQRGREWLQVLEDLKVGDVIHFRPNLTQKTYDLYDFKMNKLAADLPLLDEDVAQFKRAAKDVARYVSTLSKWCEAEVEFARNTYSSVDDIFG
ncbi:MAG: hypothetical protein C0427_09885 [Rhodobacter sp.]|nr:hypothetical protein [Rhodobacter sp.]